MWVPPPPAGSFQTAPPQAAYSYHWAAACAAAPETLLAVQNVKLTTASHCHLQEYSDETSKFYWAYGIILGALALLWLAKEAIDFVRVRADNKRVDRAGFEVGFTSQEEMSHTMQAPRLMRCSWSAPVCLMSDPQTSCRPAARRNARHSTAALQSSHQTCVRPTLMCSRRAMDCSGALSTRHSLAAGVAAAGRRAHERQLRAHVPAAAAQGRGPAGRRPRRPVKGA
jgi:hypothetical protein